MSEKQATHEAGEIKRCKKCGGKAAICEDQIRGGTFRVMCPDCNGFKGIGPQKPTVPEAIAAWNLLNQQQGGE